MNRSMLLNETNPMTSGELTSFRDMLSRRLKQPDRKLSPKILNLKNQRLQSADIAEEIDDDQVEINFRRAEFRQWLSANPGSLDLPMRQMADDAIKAIAKPPFSALELIQLLFAFSLAFVDHKKKLLDDLMETVSQREMDDLETKMLTLTQSAEFTDMRCLFAPKATVDREFLSQVYSFVEKFSFEGKVLLMMGVAGCHAEELAQYFDVTVDHVTAAFGIATYQLTHSLNLVKE